MFDWLRQDIPILTWMQIKLKLTNALTLHQCSDGKSCSKILWMETLLDIGLATGLAPSKRPKPNCQSISTIEKKFWKYSKKKLKIWVMIAKHLPRRKASPLVHENLLLIRPSSTHWQSLPYAHWLRSSSRLSASFSGLCCFAPSPDFVSLLRFKL